MNDKNTLATDENATEFMPLSEAAKLTGYTPEYLNLLARQKKLRAEKIGRNWNTKKIWLAEFLRSDSAKKNQGGMQMETQDDGRSDNNKKTLSADAKRLANLFASDDEENNCLIVTEETPDIEEHAIVSKTKVIADPVSRRFKFFSVMFAAVIVLPLLFAGSRIAKIYIANNQKNSELAQIYSVDQNTGTKISNENSTDGQVAGITATQKNADTVLASANYKINTINVGGNVMILANENNLPLAMENIKSDSFADEKKNETSLVVAWQTNKLAISELDYAKNGGQDQETVKEDSYGFSHSAVIAGLDPGTPYVFQIKSRDRWANEVDSNFFGVYTASKPVSVFDLISNAVGDVFGWAIKK